MKATELRIKNIILVTALIDRNHEETKEVIVNSDTFKLCEKYPENHNPVLLTEKWLLKFGFEKLKSQRSGYLGFLLDEFEIGSNVRQEIYYYSCSNREEYRNQCNVDLTYVHQLQNLYFALTGEELKII